MNLYGISIINSLSDANYICLYPQGLLIRQVEVTENFNDKFATELSPQPHVSRPMPRLKTTLDNPPLPPHRQPSLPGQHTTWPSHAHHPTPRHFVTEYGPFSH